MNDWSRFFKPYFADSMTAEGFISKCEALTPSDSNHRAKIMMHQTQRLISIADDLPKLRPGRESLQLLFLMICIEDISKLHDAFAGEGQSRKHVRRFFNQFLSQDDKNLLGKSFVDHTSVPMVPLGVERVINLLYDIRCDVVHEGIYWAFSFHNGQIPMVNVDPDVVVHLKFIELRDIIVRGCIAAIQDRLLHP
jgi:hypothetical protein